MRGSLMGVIQKSANPDIPEGAARLAIKCLQAETAAVARECLLGPLVVSSIFSEGVISDDTLPAGALLMAIRTVIAKSEGLATISNCLGVLNTSSGSLLQTLLSPCSEFRHSVDPVSNFSRT